MAAFETVQHVIQVIRTAQASGVADETLADVVLAIAQATLPAPEYALVQASIDVLIHVAAMPVVVELEAKLSAAASKSGCGCFSQP